MAVLPVIDLSLAAKGSHTRAEVAETLLNALESTGFFYVKGVTGFNEDELLRVCKWFFSQKKEDKMKLAKKTFNKNNSNLFKGYFPETPTFIGHNEGFEIIKEPENREGLVGHDLFYEKNVWPDWDNEECTWFKESVLKHHDRMQETGLQLLSLIAESVGLNHDYWNPLMEPGSLSTFRMLRYPRRIHPPPPEAIDGDKVLQLEEHTDSGLLTLLTTFDFTGLQIREGGESRGEWKDVPPIPGHLLVNIGDTMAEMSGRRFKSTKHRVLDMGIERFSMPFFVKPSYIADISPKQEFLSESCKSLPKSMNMCYGDYCIQKMTIYDEEREIIKLIDPSYNYSKVVATITDPENENSV